MRLIPHHPSRAGAAKAAVLAAIAAASLAAGSFHPSSSRAESAKPAEMVGDEVSEFCGNIADAARDRRYAVQTQELETLRKDIDQRIAALESKRAEYEQWLARREQVIARAEESLVGIYAKMRPNAAAKRMEKMDAALAAAILMKLSQRQAGVILNEMEVKAAAKLTGIIADVANPEDPT